MKLNPKQFKSALAAGQILQSAELSKCFDPRFPSSRPNKKQQEIFDDIETYQFRWVVSGNQAGKSSLAAREIAWVLNGDHPSWRRPAEWGTGPLTIIVAGQDRKMMELELWNNKLAPFLDMSKWREVRAGQMLQHCEHRETGDQIIFISHADSSEKNRKHMQGYVANYVWLDEMPASVKVLEELQRRVDSRRGYFLATFTPKFRNVAIKKIVDSCNPSIGKRYRMSKLDNPIFADRIQEELDKLDGYSEDMRNAILYGEWMAGDGLIYSFDPTHHGGSLPENYSPTSWRHVVVADPATESKLGYHVWAEDPYSPVTTCSKYKREGRRRWYLVESDYIDGIFVPTEIITELESRISGYRVVGRVADSHEGWFIRQAASMPGGKSYKYKGVEGKNVPGRKDEMIRESQEMLGPLLCIPDHNTKLIDELMSYERNPETGKIVAASKYHLIDCLHYTSQYLPEPIADPRPAATHDELLWNTYVRDSARDEQIRRARQSSGHRMKHTYSPADVQINGPPCLPPRPRIRRIRKW